MALPRNPEVKEDSAMQKANAFGCLVVVFIFLVTLAAVILMGGVWVINYIIQSL